MPVYYNEIDSYAAQWLRNLAAAGHIADGDVDERSIVDVRADDLAGYDQCHFFAGIGGWSHALRLAGWPDDRSVWTGSCPCQPFSGAGKRTKQSDERHLWPDWYRLISERAPPIVFGEQVDDAVAAGWLDDVFYDLEARGYSCAAAVLPACSIGAIHKRDRIWFVADACEIGSQRAPAVEELGWFGPRKHRLASNWWSREPNEAPREVESNVVLLVHGLSSRMDSIGAFGNAIVPQVAAEFVTAFMECAP